MTITSKLIIEKHVTYLLPNVVDEKNMIAVVLNDVILVPITYYQISRVFFDVVELQFFTK